MNHGQPLIRTDLRSAGRKLKNRSCKTRHPVTTLGGQRPERTGSEGGSLFAQSTVGKTHGIPLREAGQREKLAQSIISKRQATETRPGGPMLCQGCFVYLREPLSRTSLPAQKTGIRSSERQKSWQAERYALARNPAKIFVRLDHRQPLADARLSVPCRT